MNRRLSLLVLLILIDIPVFAQDKGYDVRSYLASIHLDRSRDSIWGSVTMRAHATTSLQQVVQHAKYLSIDTVRVGASGNPLSVHWIDTVSGTYMVDCNMPPGRDFELVTQYHGNPRPEQSGGNWGGVTVSDSMMFAMGVGFKTTYTSTTRHWLPCYDMPDDKADSVEFYFYTDSAEVVASNGLGSVSFLNGVRISHWVERRPIASYLLTFAVGPFTTGQYANLDGVRAQMFALSRDSIAANSLFRDIITPSVRFYDSLFAPYPFEKVGYVVTPFGSMEHQTMISLDKHALSDTWDNTTPSHELAHQWWGDWVTCKTFDDAWLNEGFATFCEDLIAERFKGRSSYIAGLEAARNYEVRMSGRRVYIDSLPIYGAATADHHTNNYPTTIYAKGAVVLGMLRQYLGDSIFFNAVRDYGAGHAYSTATTTDLEAAFERASGESLAWFFQQFVYERGAPVVDVHYRTNGKHVSIELTQMQDSLGYRFFRMPIHLSVSKSATSAAEVVWLDSVKTTRIEFTSDVDADTVVLDPDHTSLLLQRFTTATLGVSHVIPDIHISLFPNPASAEVTIEASGPVTHWQSWDVIDGRGVCVLSRRLDTTTDDLHTEIGITGLPAGAYTFLLQSVDGTQFIDRLLIR